MERKVEADKMPPAPDKWKETTAYVRWLLVWHWPGSPKKKENGK